MGSQKAYIVVGESGTYSERLQWNVGVWLSKASADARARQLMELVRELGLSASPGATGSMYTLYMIGTDVLERVNMLRTGEHGDPAVVWNKGALYCCYSVDEVELKVEPHHRLCMIDKRQRIKFLRTPCTSAIVKLLTGALEGGKRNE